MAPSHHHKLPRRKPASSSMPSIYSIAIGLGANLDQPRQQIQNAITELAAAGLELIRCSCLYETQPVDCVPGTAAFLNAALIGRWTMAPLQMLSICQEIELKLGRPRHHSSREARIIDLDLLLVDQLSMQTPPLTLPHPRLRQRAFVLAPLAEIAPDWPVPPDAATVAQLYQQLRRRPDSDSELIRRL